MNGIKIKDSRAHNVELIRTYFSDIDNTKSNSKSFTMSSTMSIVKKFVLPIIALLLIVSAGYYLYITFVKEQPDKITLLSPGMGSSKIRHYSYADIQNDINPIMLGQGLKDIAINFKKAANLSNSSIYFEAKGGNGTEKLAIILKDISKKSNAAANELIITPPLGSGEWRQFQIDITDIGLPLDKNMIKQIRFKAAEEIEISDDAVIYIKNINIKL